MPLSACLLWYIIDCVHVFSGGSRAFRTDSDRAISHDIARYRTISRDSVVAVYVYSRVQNGADPATRPMNPPKWPEGTDFEQRFPTTWPTFLKDYCMSQLGVDFFEFTGPFAKIDVRKSWEVRATLLV